MSILESIFVAILASVPIYYFLRYLWELIPIRGLKSKAVFVTGCDTGFGRDLALKLARNGQPVFAGCLTENVSFHFFYYISDMEFSGREKAGSRFQRIPRTIANCDSGCTIG